MTVKWIGSRGVFSLSDLESVQMKNNIVFPEKYVDIVSKNNGASPEKKVFDCRLRKGCIFDSLINWDKNRKANVFFWLNILEKDRLIPFGMDPFGNLICFDYSESKNPKVVFWDHETSEAQFVSNDFNSFLAALY